MIEELNKFWNKEFNGSSPEADNLKHVYKNRWVRFHSLPESKRYPENEDEFLEVFRRHNIVLQELCGNENKVLVILPEYSENRLPTKPEPELSSIFSMSVPWCTLQQHEDDEEHEFYWHLHVTEVEYSGCEFNSLFRMVANEEVSNVMIISISNSMVFHPYDGGADIILESAEKRNQLKDNHNEWLSKHKDGF